MQINDVQKGTYRNRDRDRERPRQKTKMFTQLNWLHLTWIYREKKIISTKKLIYSKQQHLIKIQRLTFYTLSRVHQQTLRHWNCRTKGNTQQIKWVQIKTIRPIFLFSFDYTFFVCSLSQLFLLVQSLLSYLIVSPFSSSPLICNFQLIRVSLVVFGILFWNNVLQLADRNFSMFFFFSFSAFALQSVKRRKWFDLPTPLSPHTTKHLPQRKIDFRSVNDDVFSSHEIITIVDRINSNGRRVE